MNCSSLLGMGDADSRQNAAPRIQLICPLTVGPLRTNAMDERWAVYAVKEQLFD